MKHLKLEKLARVNLLVGKNNSGKTSVLEALLILSGVSNTAWYDIILRGRDVEVGDDSLHELFYRTDSAEKIRLFADGVNVSGPNSYKPTMEINLSISDSHIASLASRSALRIDVQTEVMTGAAAYEFISATATGASKLRNTTAVALDVIKNEKSAKWGRLASSFVSSRPRFRNLASVLEKLKITKKDDQVVRLLRQMDDRIERLELVGDGQIYFNLGNDFPKLMSAKLMGEGLQRLLIIGSVMIHRRGGLVFIDEIDNGLHYSALRILWKGILQAAREYDVQVFATTHSAEALRHLTWVLDEEENAQYREDVATYTLIRADDDKVRSYRYGYSQLEFALERGVEVRN